MPSADSARRGVVDAAWAALVLLNLIAIAAWPSWDTIPFHLISIGFALLYGLRLWSADPVLWGLGIVIITSFAGIGLDLLHDNRQIEETAEIPLMATMFVVTVWHANRRISADRERQLIGEKTTRLLDAQHRFLQDASHHLRTPITIALTHAELLARDLDGRELRDIQLVISEIIRLRRLSERLLVIAAAEDPDFLGTEPVMLDEFAVEVITRWQPTAPRQWKLGPLDPVQALADRERHRRRRARPCLRPVPHHEQHQGAPGDRARAVPGARDRARARRVRGRPQRARRGQRVRDLAARDRR